MAVKKIILEVVFKPVVGLLIVGFFFSESVAQGKFELRQPNGKIQSVVFARIQYPCESIPDSCFRLSLSNQPTKILGKWESNSQSLIFTPLVEFSFGHDYQVFYNEKLIGQFSSQKQELVRDLRLNVYPTIDTLPANLLKMYLQFSEPMQEVSFEKFLSVVNDAGDTLKDVFLDLRPALWSGDGTRLTLWVDPGRVKRDLLRNQIMGTPLEEGKSYQLLVSSNWQSKSGNILNENYLKSFYVGSSDRKQPTPEEWLVSKPSANSQDPLTIDFGESMDFALLMESFELKDQKGNNFDGTFYFSRHEIQLTFIPLEEWSVGEHQIVIDAKLEDLAGNNLNRLFDTDIQSYNGERTQMKFHLLNIKID